MARKSTKKDIPPGFTLLHTLKGHTDSILYCAWSPDGQFIASGSVDKTIRLWNAQTGQGLLTMTGHTKQVESVAWSPDGQFIASGSDDQTIRLWNAQTGQSPQTLTGHTGQIFGVAWSPDGRALASASHDQTIRLWNAQTGQSLQTLTGHTGQVVGVAWSPDGRALASASHDQTIRLWNAQTGQMLQTLTGHTEAALRVTWSPDGRTLASTSFDNTVRLWNAQTGQQEIILEGHTSTTLRTSFSLNYGILSSSSADGAIRLWNIKTWETVSELKSGCRALAFHPHTPLLTTGGQVIDKSGNSKEICIWSLDFATLLGTAPLIPSARYTNAKVVLVGDSGVGKSGLGLVLTGQPFKATESTHGRYVWPFDSQEVTLHEGGSETRDTLLWDMAGQPGYRLIHQLHLNEVAVALVVFDGRSETDPFAGVHHWCRALKQAQRLQGNSSLPMKKFLVAARIDRGGKGVSLSRINSLVREMEFDGFFETSAKDGHNIAELAQAIREAIEWEALPKVSSTELFQAIKAFLIAEKEAGLLLSTVDDLFRMFVRTRSDLPEVENLRAQFEACIGRVESRGLIRRLSFGDLVLLQPELLDAYASALINAVKDEPDGLGSISEEQVRTGNFFMSEDERIADKEREKLLLIAMVEDLLRYELALREYADDGTYLVFPAQSTRENPNLPNPVGKTAIFRFEGPVQNIYATLSVRLSHSGLFRRKDLWKDAMTYTARAGGECGMFLHNIGEGSGELTLFFDKTAGQETRFYFDAYIQAHLQSRVLPGSLSRQLILICPKCGVLFTDEQVKVRRQLGYDWMRCSACDTKVSLPGIERELASVPQRLVQAMDQAADTQREREVATSIITGKSETDDFDVFLCHHGEDKTEVKKIGEQLKERGLLPWLDEWELQPGLPWEPLLEKQIEKIKSTAVFVGKSGMGPWQQQELYSFIREFINRGCPVIPVLLPGIPKEPQLPVFLKGMTWVDFRNSEPDPMERLIWGITGKKDVRL